MKKLLYSFLVLSLLLGLAVATVWAQSSSGGAEEVPASGSTFSLVSEATGDIESDLNAFAQKLRSLGFSEEEIQQNLAHLRPALEQSKYGIVETRTFSVVVDGRDVQAYKRALQNEGLSEESVQAMSAEFEAKIAELASSGSCKTRVDGAEALNAFGQVLYRYSSSIHWCYDGSQITALDTWDSHSTYWGWQYQGSTHNSSGGLGMGDYALHRQATMHQPVLGLYAYPDTHQRVYGDGSSWGTASP